MLDIIIITSECVESSDQRVRVHFRIVHVGRIKHLYDFIRCVRVTTQYPFNQIKFNRLEKQLKCNLLRYSIGIIATSYLMLSTTIALIQTTLLSSYKYTDIYSKVIQLTLQ